MKTKAKTSDYSAVNKVSKDVARGDLGLRSDASNAFRSKYKNICQQDRAVRVLQHISERSSNDKSFITEYINNEYKKLTGLASSTAKASEKRKIFYNSVVAICAATYVATDRFKNINNKDKCNAFFDAQIAKCKNEKSKQGNKLLIEDLERRRSEMLAYIGDGIAEDDKISINHALGAVTNIINKLDSLSHSSQNDVQALKDNVKLLLDLTAKSQDFIRMCVESDKKDTEIQKINVITNEVITDMVFKSAQKQVDNAKKMSQQREKHFAELDNKVAFLKDSIELNSGNSSKETRDKTNSYNKMNEEVASFKAENDIKDNVESMKDNLKSMIESEAVLRVASSIRKDLSDKQKERSKQIQRLHESKADALSKSIDSSSKQLIENNKKALTEIEYLNAKLDEKIKESIEKSQIAGATRDDLESKRPKIYAETEPKSSKSGIGGSVRKFINNTFNRTAAKEASSKYKDTASRGSRRGFRESYKFSAANSQGQTRY